MLFPVKLVNMHLLKLVWKLLCSLMEWKNCFKVLSFSLIWGMYCFVLFVCHHLDCFQ